VRSTVTLGGCRSVLALGGAGRQPLPLTILTISGMIPEMPLNLLHVTASPRFCGNTARKSEFAPQNTLAHNGIRARFRLLQLRDKECSAAGQCRPARRASRPASYATRWAGTPLTDTRPGKSPTAPVGRASGPRKTLLGGGGMDPKPRRNAPGRMDASPARQRRVRRRSVASALKGGRAAPSRRACGVTRRAGGNAVPDPTPQQAHRAVGKFTRNRL